MTNEAKQSNAREATVSQRPSSTSLLQSIHSMAEKPSESPIRTEDIANIELWCRQMLDALNARDFSNVVFDYVALGFESAGIDIFPTTYTGSEYLQKYRTIASENVDWHTHLDNINTELDATGTDAKVYLMVRASGRPLGLTWEAFGLMRWRKYGENWRAISHETMRAYPLDTTSPNGDLGPRTDCVACNAAMSSTAGNGQSK